MYNEKAVFPHTTRLQAVEARLLSHFLSVYFIFCSVFAYLLREIYCQYSILGCSNDVHALMSGLS